MKTHDSNTAAEDRRCLLQAADPQEYEMLEHASLPTAGGALRILCASRIGAGHLRHGLPCQDECLYRAIPHGAVLANADGISACDRGGDGARIACETAADMIAAQSRAIGSEEAFLRAVCSPDFHRSLREEWVQRIARHHQTANDIDSVMLRYGTTLTFAVVTEHWYAAFNLGDGQILFFNTHECMRLNLTAKGGPAPRSLIYPDYLQHIQCGVFPRHDFSGVLLTTDGLNDALSMLSAQAAHEFALQAAEHLGANPALPFAFEGRIGGEQRRVDLSRQLGAFDDCSLLLAINDAPVSDVPRTIHEELRFRWPQAESIELLRRSGNASVCMIADPAGYQLVLAMPEDEPLLPPERRPRHTGSRQIRLWQPAQRWTGCGLHFSAYPLPQGVVSLLLEEAQQAGHFTAPEPANPDEILPLHAGEQTARTCRALNRLRRHLAHHGLRLKCGAYRWIVQMQNQQRTLLVPEDALTTSTAPQAECSSSEADTLFPGLIGWIECRGRRTPLFDSQAAPDGSGAIHCIGLPPNALCLFQLRHSTQLNRYGILNCSEWDWMFINADGKAVPVPPGSTLTLSDGLQFFFPRGHSTGLRCKIRLF